MKKIQLPAIGGIRKVIQPGSNTVAGTTIAELGNNTISLAQLAQIITQIQSQQKNTGGGNIGDGTEATLIPGPGLSGGGPMLGAVHLNLTAPIPWFEGSGEDGDQGPPGINGANGATGAQGPLGPAVFMAAEDGQDGQDAIPGSPGVNGTNGATGAQGPLGPAVFMAAEDGQDGQDAIPGSPGVPGVSGAVGPIGPAGPAIFIFAEDGDSGDAGPPGLAGAIGPAGSGTATSAPGTIADLVYWWNSANILASAGQTVPRLKELTPWVSGAFAFNTSTTTTIGATKLNGLNVIQFPPAATAGTYNISYPLPLSSATFFAVFKPSSAVSAGGQQTFMGGATNGGLGFMLSSASGGTAIGLVKTNTAIIGMSTASWTTGAWFQANATYNGATGAFAFRQAKVFAGSGTGATGAGATVPTAFVGADSAANAGLLNSAQIAELIVYNRVLTTGEISTIETYLTAEWGV